MYATIASEDVAGQFLCAAALSTDVAQEFLYADDESELCDELSVRCDEAFVACAEPPEQSPGLPELWAGPPELWAGPFRPGNQGVDAAAGMLGP